MRFLAIGILGCLLLGGCATYAVSPGYVYPPAPVVYTAPAPVVYTAPEIGRAHV